MTIDQFGAWLLFVIPSLMVLFIENLPLMDFIILLVPISIFLLSLFFIAEHAFVESCQQGFEEWENSILPKWFYRRWIR